MPGLSAQRLHGQGFWLLCFVRMLGTRIDFQLLEHLPAKRALRKHAANGGFNDERWSTLSDVARRLKLRPTGVTTVAEVLLLKLLGTGESDFVGIDHDNEVARVNVWREGSFVLATQNAGNARCQSADYHVLSVDHKPFALYVGRLGTECSIAIFVHLESIISEQEFRDSSLGVPRFESDSCYDLPALTRGRGFAKVR